MATTDTINNNAQVFKKYYAYLSNEERYSEFVNKLAKWLSDARAYYDAARPEIVTLLQHAQATLKTFLGVDANATFNVHNHPIDDPKITGYVALVKTVYRFIRKFSQEDHLRQQIQVLYRSTVNPADIIDVDVFQIPPPSATRQNPVGVPSIPSQPSQLPSPLVPTPQSSSSDIPPTPAIANTLPQVENTQATYSSSPAPSTQPTSNKRKAAKAGSSSRPRKKQKKVDLNWDEIRRIDESHHLGRQSQEAGAEMIGPSTSTPDRAIDRSPAQSMQPSVAVSVEPNAVPTVPMSIQRPVETSELADTVPPSQDGLQLSTSAHDTSSVVNSLDIPSRPSPPTAPTPISTSKSVSTRNTPAPILGISLENLKATSKSASPAPHSNAGTLNFLDLAFEDGSSAMQSPAVSNTVLSARSIYDSQSPERMKSTEYEVKTEDQEDELDEAGVIEELIEPGSGFSAALEPSSAQELDVSTAESEKPQRTVIQEEATAMSSAEFEQSEKNNIQTARTDSAGSPEITVEQQQLAKETSRSNPGSALIHNARSQEALPPPSAQCTDVPMAGVQTQVVEEPTSSASLVGASELSCAIAEPLVDNPSAEESSLHESALQQNRNTSLRDELNVVNAMRVDVPARAITALVDNGAENTIISHIAVPSAPVQKAPVLVASSHSQSLMSTTSVAAPAFSSFSPSEHTPPTAVQNATKVISDQQGDIFKGTITLTNRSMNAADIRIPSYRGFDDRSKMLKKAEGRQTSATITLTIHVTSVQFESIALWNNRFRAVTNLTMTKGLCMSLACYRREDIERELKVSVYQNFPHQLYNALKCVWPRGGKKLVMKVIINEQARSVPLSPPMATTADGFVDLGPFVAEGKNTIQIDHSGDMSRYTFCLHAHYPTKGQLEELQHSMKQNEEWQHWIQHVSRPLELPPSPFAQVSA